MSGLDKAVADLHRTIRIEIDVQPLPNYTLKWTSTVRGEDFLDGPWEQERQGVALRHDEAFRDAVDAHLLTPRKKKRWWQR